MICYISYAILRLRAFLSTTFNLLFSVRMMMMMVMMMMMKTYV